MVCPIRHWWRMVVVKGANKTKTAWARNQLVRVFGQHRDEQSMAWPRLSAKPCLLQYCPCGLSRALWRYDAWSPGVTGNGQNHHSKTLTRMPLALYRRRGIGRLCSKWRPVKRHVTKPSRSSASGECTVHTPRPE